MTQQVRSEFRWAQDVRGTAADNTRGTLRVLNCQTGETIWQLPLSWTWVELLEWFAENWEFLTAAMGENGREELEAACPGGDEDAIERAADARYAFTEAHDLARALQGILAPSLLVWRDEATMHICHDGQETKLPWWVGQQWLEDTGNQIAARLAEFYLDRRGTLALDAWRTAAG